MTDFFIKEIGMKGIVCVIVVVIMLLASSCNVSNYTTTSTKDDDGTVSHKISFKTTPFPKQIPKDLLMKQP